MIGLAVDIDRNKPLLGFFYLGEEMFHRRRLPGSGRATADGACRPGTKDTRPDPEGKLRDLFLPEDDLIRDVIKFECIDIFEERLISEEEW